MYPYTNFKALAFNEKVSVSDVNGRLNFYIALECYYVTIYLNAFMRRR